MFKSFGPSIAYPALLLVTGGCSNLTGNTQASVPQNYQEQSMDFDREKWADEAAAYKEPYPRQQMLKALPRVLKPGMSKDDVIRLLGKETDTDKFTEYDLVYWVGPEKSAISIDSQWLVLDFDDDQKLKTFKAMTD